MDRIETHLVARRYEPMRGRRETWEEADAKTLLSKSESESGIAFLNCLLIDKLKLPATHRTAKTY